MKTMSAEQRAEALRAARGVRRIVPGLRCGIRYLPSVPQPAPMAPALVVTPPGTIRAWAATHGVPCAARGRVPAAVVEAFQTAMRYRASRRGVAS
jgi:hypothetical protein